MPDDLVYDAAQLKKLADVAAAEIARLRSELNGANARIKGLQQHLKGLEANRNAWLHIYQPDIAALADFIVALEPKLQAQVLARVAVRLEAIEPTGLVT